MSVLSLLRLTDVQKRHLVEMLPTDPLDPPTYWTTNRRSPQNRSAVALAKKGLLKRADDYSQWSFNHPAFVLTELGRQVAEALVAEARR